MGGTKKTVLDFRLADMPARQGMSAFEGKSRPAVTEPQCPFTQSGHALQSSELNGFLAR